MKALGFNLQIPEWTIRNQKKNDRSKTASVQIIEDETIDGEIDEIQFQVIFKLFIYIVRNLSESF